jgi:hypothetical protein
MSRASCKCHVVAAIVVAAAALTGGGSALAQPRPAPAAATANPADAARALAHYTKGGELYKAKRFALALDEFRQSYALVKSPNSHLYIARCVRETGDARAAYIEFDKVAEEAAALVANAPKYMETQRAAEQERDDLTTRLGVAYVNVSNADATTTIRLGGYDVPPDRWGKAFPIEPGTYDLVVQKGGRVVMKQSVTLRPGDKRPVTANAAAVLGAQGAAGVAAGPSATPTKSGPTSPLRIGAFVAGGVGVVGMAMFAAGGILSKSTYSNIVTICDDKPGCPGHNVSSQISTGKTQQTLANVGVTVGAIGLATGVTLFVLSTRPKKDTAARPSAELVVRPTWLGAEGSF